MTDNKQEAAKVRLGTEIAARRKELQLSANKVIERGGPARDTQRNWEGGRIPAPSATRDETMTGYERALDWAPGHMSRLLRTYESAEGSEASANHGVSEQDWAEDTERMKGTEAELRRHLLLVTQGVDGIEGLALTVGQRRALEKAQYHIGKLAMELFIMTPGPLNITTEEERDTD